jgi:ferritin-like metal-binding protein YciE
MKTDPSADQLLFRLREIYEREMQLGASLPVFSSITCDGELRELIREQTQSTGGRTECLLAILNAYEISPEDSGDDGVRSIISGADMQLADVEDHSMRDLLVAAHYLRIGHDGIAIYREAASLARLAGSIEIWELLANAYVEQEATVYHLDSIGERLFEGQIRDPGPDRKVA